ncbi:hypothetical protein B0T17DRAFT_520498 [Bombardia bombarda]|uniref:Ankyrin repeat protein n=1 Tax=Bombardia bombarda TaxID=252184 RepID=A0AA39XQ08_9PEZI|nr:hypothetical protein B0T17DRAFT_520498 [Bombardia bombarda]
MATFRHLPTELLPIIGSYLSECTDYASFPATTCFTYANLQGEVVRAYYRQHPLKAVRYADDIMQCLVDMGARLDSSSRGYCSCIDSGRHFMKQREALTLPMDLPERSPLHHALCNNHTETALKLVKMLESKYVSKDFDERCRFSKHGQPDPSVGELFQAICANVDPASGSGEINTPDNAVQLRGKRAQKGTFSR